MVAITGPVEIKDRFLKIQDLLTELLPLVSAWDLNAIEGERLSHPWIDQISQLSPEEQYHLDGQRNFQILKDPTWIKTLELIKELTSYKKSSFSPVNLKTLGKKKKQHELERLYSLLEKEGGKSAVDFGGGVGNLAYFLEQNLSMKVDVLERDPDLISSGIKKLSKYDSKITFTKVDVSFPPTSIPSLANSELSIGLHTCGEFANNMIRGCIFNRSQKSINFGCCYSKIKNNDYHLSSLSDKNLVLNYRALSAATLGFSVVPKEIYDYRLKIMKYKFSFYHWLYKTHGILEFCSMSNARRSLYKNNFSGFVHINLEKFFPQIAIPSPQELNYFFESDDNLKLNNYFKSYYTIARYIGELLESYILCDRALFLQENNYQSEIMEVFDSTISPRNKAIIATRINNN